MVTNTWDSTAQSTRRPNGGPAFFNGLLVGLVLLSSASLGLLLGYGVANWSGTFGTSVMGSTPSGPSLMSERASPRALLSWRNVPTIRSNGSEK